MNNVSRIVLNKRDYEQQLWTKVAQQIQLLMESGYACTVYDADDSRKGLIVIEFALMTPMLGAPQPYWLTPDEADHLMSYRDSIEKLSSDEDNNNNFQA